MSFCSNCDVVKKGTSCEYTSAINWGDQTGTLHIVHHPTLAIAKHHFIIFEVDGWCAVFEWVQNVAGGLVSFLCKRKDFTDSVSWCHASHGKCKAAAVYKAIQDCSKGRSYSVKDYNCNHWTNQIAQKLGQRNVNVGNLACR